MYICRDCGTLFEEPRKIIETHGLDTPPYEELYGCPRCGGDYTETYVCCECGKYIMSEFVVLKNGEHYCNDCYDLDDVMS